MTAQPADPPEVDLEPDRLTGLLIFLTQINEDLSHTVPDYLDRGDDTAAVLLLDQLRQARQALQSVEAFVEADVAGRFGKGKHPVAGFTVEVKGGSTWKDWRHDDVAWQLCRDIAVDPDTGEINADIVPIIDMVRSRLLNAARPSWRTTVLGQHGLKPSDYATWTESRRTVQIVADVDAAGAS